MNHEILNVIPSLVSVEDNIMLTSIPTADEIKNITFSIEADNSPRPDGFTAAFFINYWNSVSSNVIAAVQSFFREIYLLELGKLLF